MAIEKVGFIGAGVMASALIEGMKSLCLDIAVSDPAGTKAGIRCLKSNRELTDWADLVVFSVKPHVLSEVMADVAPVAHGKPFVSIVTGVQLKDIRSALPGARVIRTMPNTPALVGQGMTVLATPHSLSEDEFIFVRRMFECVGKVIEIEEALMAAVTAISGSGPAYFFLLIEALADAGVRHGLPRAIAYNLAAQTAVGAGTMQLQTGNHPGILKDGVCSPGGTTIVAIEALERAGARAAMMDAVNAAYVRAKELES